MGGYYLNIIIQKFGGTSVSTKDRKNQVVAKVKKAIENGYKPVVVISAMGRFGEPYATDTLLSLIDDDYKENNLQGTDLIMCCGEIISTVVMSNELISAGIKSIPLTGGQAGIITDNSFGDASIKYIKKETILNYLEKGIIPVISGFQGISEDGYLTTLGRGGSDTSACILGSALKADLIEIYTDVDGMMTADPRIVNNATLIENISYKEVFQFANQGVKVIHPRAVSFAKEANIPIYVKNTMTNAIGTLIDNIEENKKGKFITGITYLSNRTQVIIKYEENLGNKNYRALLDKIAKSNISLDLINIFPTEQIFTIDSNNNKKLISLLKELNLNYSIKKCCSKIAIVGIGMMGVAGIMAKIMNTLSKEKIEVLQTADSNMTIWCLIEDENLNKAINVLHEVFKLGE